MRDTPALCALSFVFFFCCITFGGEIAIVAVMFAIPAMDYAEHWLNERGKQNKRGPTRLRRARGKNNGS